MKLAHLSDLHLGGSHPRKRARRVKALIDRAIGEGIDHLLLGGDLVDSADLDDLDPLVEHLRKRRFFSASRLSVVPGNHDCWPFSFDDLGSQILKEAVDSAGALVSSSDWPAQERYEQFGEIFSGTFKGTAQYYDEDPYPCVKVVGDLAIVMLDTTSDTPKRCVQGNFDNDEGEFVLGELEAHDGPRVLHMHHVPWQVGPFDASAHIDELSLYLRVAAQAYEKAGGDLDALGDPDFRDLRAVRRFIRKAQFDAVLCGHVHVFDADDIRSPDYRGKVGNVPVYCMGRSGAVDQDWDEAVFAYDLITVSSGRVKVSTRYVPGDDLD